jgi:antitoxin component YwqK of YwqJK toxin-antitoxin module
MLKAKGKYKNEKLHGDWQWYRKTGVILRSGSFKNGAQVGIWTTYDLKGKVYKITDFLD